MTEVERLEADALTALYAAALPNETLPETVTRLCVPTFDQALEAAAASAYRDLSEPPP